jgi:hypothetical protein
MTTTPGPKEQKVRALREDAGDIPDFLKRAETPEQAEKRRKKYAKPDTSKGLTVIEPVAPIPDKIKKAIEKDLKDEPSIPIAELHEHPAAKANAESWDKIPAVKKAGREGDHYIAKGPKKKLPRALQKALAEKEKLNQPKHSAEAQNMENTVKTKTATKKSTAKPAVKNGRADGLRDGSKLALLIDTAVAAGKKGIAMKELAKKVGWERCADTLRKTCKRIGAKLEEKDDRVVVSR